MSARPAYQRSGPWDAADTLYFYGGEFSNFAQTPGLALPGGWYGHPRTPALVAVPDVEHYFQACKATSLEDFLWIMEAPTAVSAKRRGGRRGEGGRRIELRPDWEEVKFLVMGFACLAKFKRQPFHRTLLATGERALVENSPSDFIWGGRDRNGGYSGRNLLGLVLMDVRAKLRGSLVAA